MTRIRIREQVSTASGFTAIVSFDEDEYPITVQDPFAASTELGAEERLAWYFEEHLTFPFTRQVEAEEAARSITRYGEQLFTQVFAGPAAQRYAQALAQPASITGLTFEIVGSPAFQQLHWEALKDPALPRPFVIE